LILAQLGESQKKAPVTGMADNDAAIAPFSYSASMADVVLQPEQERLLATLVEAARSLRPDRREPFWFTPVMSQPHRVQHPGLPGGAIDPYPGDWKALADEGLLRVTPTATKGCLHIDVTPRGFQHYSEMKAKSGKPVEVMESHIRNYLDSVIFKEHYPAAWEKWSHAEELLWSADSARQLTNIGHLCREAAQEFAEAFVKRQNIAHAGEDKAHTVARVRVVLKQLNDTLGRDEGKLLEALLTYWGTVSDLIQRQEHGGQKEGTPLTWEDARRVVFHTAVVMFEIDRVVQRNGRRET
jgi:hypothetical protein